MYLGDILIKEGLVTEEQLKEALNDQKCGGGIIGLVMVEKGYITDCQLLDVLKKQANMNK